MTAATSRIIQRALASTGPWTTITTVAPTATTYKDTSVTNGTEYFYRVIGVNAVGNSAPSNVASATPSAFVGPPFDANLIVWLDPTDSSTMWQDSGKTTPVTTDGDPIGYWEDKSGNGNHWSQSDNSRRPVWKTDHVLFTNDWLTCINSLAAETDGTIGFDVQADPSAGNGCLFQFSTATGATAANHWNFSGSHYNTFCSGIRTLPFAWASVTQSSGDRMTYIVTEGAFTAIIYLDGSQVDSRGQGNTNMGTTPILGGANRLGDIASFTMANTRVYEMVVYDRVLTAGEVTTLDGYLTA
jgi:hypothetical protein